MVNIADIIMTMTITKKIRYKIGPLIPKLSAPVELEIGGICQISKKAIGLHELYLLEVFGHVYYTVIIEICLTD